MDNNLNQANFSDYYTTGVVYVVTLGPLGSLSAFLPACFCPSVFTNYLVTKSNHTLKANFQLRFAFTTMHHSLAIYSNGTSQAVESVK